MTAASTSSCVPSCRHNRGARCTSSRSTVRRPWPLLLLLLLVHDDCSASSAAGTETLIGIVGRDFVILGADSSLSQSIVVTASHVDKIAVLAEPTKGKRLQQSQDQQEFDSDDTVATRDFNHHCQQCIAAAAAGDAADADRLLGLLQSEVSVAEYEASVGCDVRFIDCSTDSNNGGENAKNNPSIGSIPTPPGLSVEQVARLARSHISSRLRSATPLRVCLLVAGMEQGPERRLPSSILVPGTLLPFASEQVQKQVLSTTTVSSVAVGEAEHEQSVRALAMRATSHLQPRLYWLDEYGSIQSLLYGAHGHGSHFALSILDQGYRPDMTRSQAISLMRGCFAQLRTRYVINAPQPPCIKCIDASGCHVIE